MEAIGDNATLQARLLDTSQGQAWFGLVNGLGFGYEAENVNRSDSRPARCVPCVT